MKIQCDVCHKDEASVFCYADEAALCATCDHHVHHANKLSLKHQRFSLLLPNPIQSPLCDICQEKRAFLFCQQDRAILCKDCDMAIHRANEHTQKHNRFLLTGVKLSATSTVYSPPQSSITAAGGCDSVPDLEKAITHKPFSAINPNPSSSITSSRIESEEEKVVVSDGEIGPPPPPPTNKSSISDYLTHMLPGWHVEDFLDSSSSPILATHKEDVEEDVLRFWDSEIESNLTCFTSENMGIWVPQAPNIGTQVCPYSNMGFDDQTEFMEFKEATKMKSNKNWREDGCFTVPQIIPSFTPSKRPRKC